ncbi:MAG: Rieske 2Fe-2S domain-containing protein [Pseudomonadales bacterium]|nr:Rieske 2Fe-2S domain-containing protein [Pseudomonadales bacterium]
MRQQVQIDIAKRIFDLKDNQTTDLADNVYQQSKNDYISPEVAQQEQQNLFRDLPLLLCLSCEIPEPGDYICDDFSGVPIIGVRTSNGDVAAYLNICRHRGARLACDKGSGLRQMRCPYHAWSYAADTGNLLAVPFNTGFEGINKDDFGLLPLPVIEHDGLIFVRPSAGDAIDPTQFLNTFNDDLAGYGLSQYSHFETRVLEAPLNWKLVVDTFLETYHLSALHSKTIAPLLHNNLMAFEPMGQHLRMVAARKTIDDLRSMPEQQWDLILHTAMVYVLFPNTVFIMQGDHLETWRVYPGATPNESRMHVSLYTPEPTVTESARKHWKKNMDLLMATVLSEDFPLATNIQQDFSACNNKMLFGRNEPALQHYHKTLTANLRCNHDK